MTDLKTPHQALAAALVLAVVATTESRAAQAVEHAEQIAASMNEDDVSQVKDIVEICLTMLSPGEDSAI